MVERHQEVLATDPVATRATFTVAAGASPSTASPPDCLPAAIFRSASDAWLLADRRASVVRVNAAAAALLGPDLTGRPLADVIAGDPDEGVADAIVAAVRHGTSGSAQVRLSCCGRWHLAIAFPHEDGVAVLLHDVHDHREAEARARFAALTDALTGLPNRPALYECLRALLGRRDASVSALFIDLDRFKRVNDQWGHLAGDETLRAVASALRSSLREGDVLVRYGGDEFCALLPSTDLGAAHAAADRVRDAVRAVVVDEGSSLRLGASVGIATTGDLRDEDGAEVLVRLADRASLAAKRHGGDRVFEAGSVEARSVAWGDLAH